MRTGVVLRLARPEEAYDIVEVVRSSFEAELLMYMVYGCQGVAGFVRHQIEGGGFGGDTVYTVATREERFVGFAETRVLADAVFLNYISLRPEARYLGLGKDLLLEALRESRRWSQDRVLLDVFEHNHMARGWYERMGFEPTGVSGWWEVTLAAVPGAARAILVNYPQAQVTQEKFGFSLFELVTPGGRYSVGRLGDEWFRMNQPGALTDPAVAAALARIGPGRRVLAALPDGALPESLQGAALPLARSVRMTLDCDALHELLGPAEVAYDDGG